MVGQDRQREAVWSRELQVGDTEGECEESCSGRWEVCESGVLEAEGAGGGDAVSAVVSAGGVMEVEGGGGVIDAGVGEGSKETAFGLEDTHP